MTTPPRVQSARLAEPLDQIKSGRYPRTREQRHWCGMPVSVGFLDDRKERCHPRPRSGKHEHLPLVYCDVRATLKGRSWIFRPNERADDRLDWQRS